MKRNMNVKILICINVITTVLIMMNLAELLGRLVEMTKNSGLLNYTYTSHYNVSMEVNDLNETDMKEAYQTIDNLLSDMAALPFNVSIPSVGGMIDNGENIFCTLYLSMKEPLPYTLEIGTYDEMNERGVYIGNRYEGLIKDGYINIFREKLPVSGIMKGIGFNKNDRVVVKYSDLNKSYRSETVCELSYATDDGIRKIYLGIDVGSNLVKLNQIKTEFEDIMKRYPDVTYKATDYVMNQEGDSNNFLIEGMGNLKSVLYVIAVMFCIISSIYVINLYLTSKKKYIAISYALGLSKRITFLMIIKEIGQAFIGGVCISFVLEIIVYIALRGYAVGTVLLYGVGGAFSVFVLYLGIIYITFMKIFRKGIVRELGGE